MDLARYNSLIIIIKMPFVLYFTPQVRKPYDY
jgi:hypothetical protein